MWFLFLLVLLSLGSLELNSIQAWYCNQQCMFKTQGLFRALPLSSTEFACCVICIQTLWRIDLWPSLYCPNVQPVTTESFDLYLISNCQTNHLGAKNLPTTMGHIHRFSQSNSFWHAAVHIMGSALPSAAKSNKSHYQSEVFVCVSVIRELYG